MKLIIGINAEEVRVKHKFKAGSFSTTNNRKLDPRNLGGFTNFEFEPFLISSNF